VANREKIAVGFLFFDSKGLAGTKFDILVACPYHNF
jgi:hypothetical protein